MKKLILFSFLLMNVSVNANQDIMPRGQSPEEVNSWVEKYQKLHNEAVVGNNQSAKLKIAKITFACANAYDRSVIQACAEEDVGPREEGLELLISAADSGYVPAQIYYSRSVPPGIDMQNQLELDEYSSRRSTYLEEAISKGNGQAMFLHAYTVRQVRPASLVEQTKAQDAYVHASAALKCGYRDENVYPLLNYLIESFDIDIAQAKQKTKEIVKQFCRGEGG
jgi:hypothetical protein